MLKFVPVSNEKLTAPFCEDSSVSGYIGYDLSNDSRECGTCAFKINGYSMDILDVNVPSDDAETTEGLIRSALNFGGNRNVYIAYYKAAKGVNVALMLGFKDENGTLSGDIPTLLKGSCCKGK